jgi:hypothetical protein
MNKNVLEKIGQIQSKVELSDVRVDLGTIDEIKFQVKSISGVNDTYNKLDAIIQKNVKPISDAYKQIIINKDYQKKINPVLDKLQATLTKQASDLGLDVKSLPAYKDLMDAYQFVDQVNDSITNSISAVQSIGK